MSTEKELVAWRRQRRGIRLNCSREITKTKQYLNPDADASPEDFQSSLTVLREYRDDLKKLNSDILLHTEKEVEANADVEEASEFDYDLAKHISVLSARLESCLSARVANSVAADRPGSPGGIGSHHSTSGHRYGTIKLPKLELAKFDGDPLKWIEFWDSFETTIHENNGLSDVEKFKYLKNFLKGDALDVVGGYLLTSANYTEAVTALKERFGNKQLAIFSHFESMLALSPSNYDTHQLQKIYDTCEKHIRSLVALGLEEGMFGQVFTPIILSKLPVGVKMEIHRRNGSKPWELANLREYLREEIRVRDYSNRTFGGSKGSGEGGKQQSHNQRFRSHHSSQSHKQQPAQKSSCQSHTTADSLVAHDRPKPRCIFCLEAHFSDQCKKFADVDSRKEVLKTQRRCFVCFSTKHGAKDCESQTKCFHCKKRHHQSLCFSKFPSSSSSSTSQKSNTSASLHMSSSNVVETDPELSAVNSSLLSHGETAILQTALSTVRGSGSLSQARFLFDTGCTRSFITTELCRKINARHIGQETTSIAGFADTKRKTITYKTVEFDVLLPDGDKRTVTANVTPTISCPIRKLPLDVKSYPVLKQMQLAEPLLSEPAQLTIDILLGSDFYYDFIGTERLNFPNGMILLSSVLGFIVTGRVKDTYASKAGVTSLFFSSVDAHPGSVQVEKFWSLEDIGIKSPSATNDDEEALVDFNKSIRFENGRYQVKFPWKKAQKDLPENYQLAAGRLRSLLKRITPQQEVVKKYNETIQDQISKGVVEVAPVVPTGDRVHYIPHHCVITPNKATTKLRVVYDASAKASKTAPSLNDCLHRGPVILDDLCGILMKFRLHAIGLISDIEKAFLQIGLQECERDATRFLWVKDLTKEPVGDNIVVYRFCRVLFGAISSPFLLGGTIKHHLAQSQSPVASSLEGCIYVDNIANGKPTTEEAIDFYKVTKKLFSEASMNLREWFTNCPSTTEAIKPEDRGKSVETKVLGLNWDTEKDTLNCVSFDSEGEMVTTKRQMLKYLAKVFDPCGYFSAVTVVGKILIQQLWQDKLGWDDVLPQDIIAEWKKCCKSLQQIGKHRIPRCYDPNIGKPGTQYDLHCFCDASGKAYAAVVYLVVTTESGSSSNIVFAKSRVGPIKKLSIPRLELMAVVVGVRLLAFVKSCLGLTITEQYLWSDSQCVLQWLVKRTVETVFVKNRVAEINSHPDVVFRYVPTSINPADLSSRGHPFEKIVNNDLWWHGPSWLVEGSSKWPKDPFEHSSVVVEETRHEPEIVPEIDVNVVQSNSADCCIDRRRFSSLKRLLRVTAWVKRFVHNCRSRIKQRGSLVASELASARLFWDRVIQKEHFFKVIDGSKDAKTKQLVRQLGLFVDNAGLVRCGGRIQASTVEFDAKHPTLLPKDEQYTDLVISEVHEKLCHSGVGHTLSQVRQSYWITHGRSQVKKIVKRCYICKLIHGGPYRYPDPPPLPDFRVSRQKPFATVGIDYLGPLTVKDAPPGHEKVWMCLFTCAVTRAVHLEVVENLTAYQFVLCLRRFIARFGTPKLIISDNAKHFVKAKGHLSRVWGEILNSPSVHEFSADRGISWKFITELSPWMGGFYERMVGLVKNGLKKTLNKKLVSFTELQTIASEVAAIVNSRPLVYVDSEPNQLALSPSHFLGGPYRSLPSVDISTDNYSPKIPTDTDLIELWQRTNNILNEFWKHWQNQYLLSLRERPVHTKQRNVTDIKPNVGSVVIVKDNLVRKNWKIGRIAELSMSHDGVCRSAVVKLASDKSINRPLRLLFPLEHDVLKINRDAVGVVDNASRQHRKAFIQARHKLKTIAHLESTDDCEELV